MEFNRENIRQEQLKDAKLYSTRYEYAEENIMPGTSALELGTLAGDYAQFLLDTGNIKSIDLIDKFDQGDWDAPGVTKRFTSISHYDFVLNRFKDDHRVNIFKGLTQEVLPTLNKGYDYIYIDDYHMVDHVHLMLSFASNMLNPGGVIGLNDYTKYGLIREQDYNNYPYEKMVYGVIEAVNHFLLINPEWKVKAFSLNDRMFSDIYLHKPDFSK